MPTNKTPASARKTTAGKKAGSKTAAAVKATKTLRLGKTTANVESHADGTTTLHLKRLIRAPAERVYQCFLDPDAYAKWIPPHGFTGRVHSMDPRVGGTFRMSFSTINRSWGHAFGGTYLELVPNRRIVHTDKFEDESMGKGTMTVTVDLKPVKGGTEVSITQAGIPKGPAGEGAPYGWSQSLDNLATLCEQELPF